MLGSVASGTHCIIRNEWFLKKNPSCFLACADSGKVYSLFCFLYVTIKVAIYIYYFDRTASCCGLYFFMPYNNAREA